MKSLFQMYPLADLELAYKTNFLKDDKQMAFASITIVLFATHIFIYNDYLLFGLSHSFYSLLVTRAIHVSIALVTLSIIARTQRPITLERATLVAVLAHISLNWLVDFSRPSANFAVSPINLLTVLGIYLFIPNRIEWRTAPAVLFSLAELFLATFVKDISPIARNGLWIMYTTGNLLGLITALRLENSRRAQYKANSQEQAARQELERLANTDSLTGIANRRAFLELATHELERFRRYHHPLSLILFDLDHFKQINDQHGHAAGDEALRAVAKMVMQQKRTSDVFGRLGGEEFGLLLPEVAQADALMVGQRLLAQCNTFAFSSEAGPYHVTFSGGVAQAASTDQTVDHILQRADRALYRAKHTGRNRLELAGD